MAELEDFPDLTVDAGDYALTLDAGRIGQRIGVTRLEIVAKPGEGPIRTTITRETLAAIGRTLQEVAERLVGDHLATTEHAFGSGTIRYTVPGGGATFEQPVSGGRIVAIDRKASDVMAEGFSSRRRERLTGADYQDIAEIVRQAQEDRRPIHQAVADARDVTPSRAGHLIKIARDRGYLPPIASKGDSRAEDR